MSITPAPVFGQAAIGVKAAIRNLETFLAELATAPAEEFVRPGVAAPTSIHVPEFEMEPFGKFLIELDMADAQAHDRDVEAIIQAIKAIGVKNVKRLLVDSDARPPSVAGSPIVKGFVRKTKNLISLYHAEVARLKAPPIPWGVVALVGVGGVALIGGVLYIRKMRT